MVSLLKKDAAPPCFPGFERVNRFWSPQQKKYVAKILPGEFYVSRADEMIATTLGSCVSACIWDQQNNIGGMNHFMLPMTEVEASKVAWGSVQNDATRYGNYAMEHMINEILKNGGMRSNLMAKVFGGGRVLNHANDVGAGNIEFVLEYLKCENIPIISKDLGDTYPRKVMFNPLNGKALMKKMQNIHNNEIVSQEVSYSQSICKKPVEGEIELF